MLRLALLILLLIFIARAFWRVMDGIMAELRGPGGSAHVPGRGVQMARDPVCGTFVVPDRAVVLSDGTRHVFFCSTTCRDKYRARTA